MARRRHGAREDVQTGSQQTTEARHARAGFRCGECDVLRHLERHRCLRYGGAVVWGREREWVELVGVVQGRSGRVLVNRCRGRRRICRRRRQLRVERRVIRQQLRVWKENGSNRITIRRIRRRRR